MFLYDSIKNENSFEDKLLVIMENNYTHLYGHK